MIERKCSDCGTWNKGEDFCQNCNAALSPKEVIKAEDIVREKKRIKEVPVDKLDVWLKKQKNSKYLIVRIGYYVFGGVWFIVMGVASFFAYLTAYSIG